MPSYDYKCKSCEYTFVDIVSYDDRDNIQECPDCGAVNAFRFYGKMPGVTRASYVDGTKRKGFDTLKEVNKLEIEKADLPPEKRTDINKEIKRLKKL